MQCPHALPTWRPTLLMCLSVTWLTTAHDPTIDALAIVEGEVADPTSVWPPSWQQRYIATVRDVLDRHRAQRNYALRLAVVREGFAPFYARIRETSCTPIRFDVYRAEIRWFLETVMSEPLASETERALLRSQYRDLCDFAGAHLQGQFPFLEDRYVHEAQRRALRAFDLDLAAPLVPLYRRPFSDDQLRRAQTHWAGSYKRWDSLWRRVQSETVERETASAGEALATHPQCRFVERCLRCLPQSIWPTLERPPAYVLKALAALRQEKRDVMQTYLKTRRRERQLTSRFSNNVEQIEQWGFVFTALLETALDPPAQSPGSAAP